MLKHTEAKTCFVLPEGDVIGGVNTWSVQMARALGGAGQETVQLAHGGNACGDGVIPVPGCVASESKVEDLLDYSKVYSDSLPAVFIPNYSSGTYAACAALSAFHAEQMRVLGMVHSDEDPYYEWMEYYEPIIHTFVAVSDEIGDELCRRIPRRQGDIVVLPYGIHVSDDVAARKTDCSRPLNIVFAGRLDRKQKRADTLIPLLDELNRLGVEASLNVVGSGECDAELAEKCAGQRSDASTRMVIHPPMQRETLLQFFGGCDLYISLAEYEGTSIAMLEAMERGCVPVVTAVSGTSRAIDPLKNGFVTNIGDVEAAAMYVQNIAINRDRLPAMSMAARQTVRTCFGFDEYFNSFRNVLSEIWKKPARTWPTKRPMLPLVPSVDRRYRRHMSIRGEGATMQRRIADSMQSVALAIEGQRRTRRLAAMRRSCEKADRDLQRVRSESARALAAEEFRADRAERALAEVRMEQLVGYLQAQGIASVTLFGGGKHSLRIIPRLHDLGIETKAVLDDNSDAACGSLPGVAVLCPGAILDPEKHDVVISSDSFEAELYERACAYPFRTVTRIYGTTDISLAGDCGVAVNKKRMELSYERA